MKNRFLLILLLIVLIALISSCNGSPNTSFSSIKSFDMTGAKALVVVPTKMQGLRNMSKAVESVNHFCKITEKGEIEEIYALDKNGNRLNIVPTRIFDAGKYVILYISSLNYYSESKVFLVSKQTGDTYDMSSIGCPEVMRNNLGYDTFGRQSVFTDIEGRIYFIKEGRVARINVSDPNNIKLEYITPDSYRINSVNEFAVDGKGNVLFSIDSNVDDTIYLKKTNGSIEKIFNNARSICFTGYDKNIYVQIKKSYSGQDERKMQKLKINDDYTVGYEDYSDSGLSTWYSGGYRWLYLKDKIIVIGSINGQCEGVESVVYDAISSNNYFITRSFLKTSEIADIQAGMECYFVAKTDGSLLKVNPGDNNFEIILNAGSYDIKKIVSANDNKISFSGVRYSDGKKILCTINVDTKAISVVNDSLSDDIIVLQKLN